MFTFLVILVIVVAGFIPGKAVIQAEDNRFLNFQ